MVREYFLKLLGEPPSPLYAAAQRIWQGHSRGEKMQDSSSSSRQENAAEDQGVQRRNVLRLGVYAAYTAPVLLAMVSSSAAAQASTASDCELPQQSSDVCWEP